MSEPNARIIIIGAGLAGLEAARHLNGAGCAVTVLEARNRIGGRAFSKPFAGGGRFDLGGSWIAPGHTRVRDLVARNGLNLVQSPPFETPAWRVAGTRGGGHKLPRYERKAIVALARRIRDDARSHAAIEALRDLPLERYLDDISPSAAARAFAIAWLDILTACPPANATTGALLDSVVEFGGHLGGYVQALTDQVDGGADAMAYALAKESGATIALESPVASLALNDDIGCPVTVATADGRTRHADAAILAVPVNVLADIDMPRICGALTRLPERPNSNRAVKVVMLTAGLSPGDYAVGGGAGLNWLRVNAERGVHQVVIGFGHQTPEFDPGDEDDVRRALDAFYPAARLIDWAWHDWTEDPQARGGWITVPPGATALFDAGAWDSDTAIAFATSDIAPSGAGWFEGALASGEHAARRVLDRLARRP